jgi:hypothetical protein
MNEANQKFIDEFKVRAGGHQAFNARVHALDNKRNQINASLNRLCYFLNKKVMGKSTSSLIRLQVELPYAADHYNAKDYTRKITINHKGMGTMREPKPQPAGSTGSSRSTYGTTFSDEAGDNEFMEMLTNPLIRDAIKADLLKQNCYKALRYFNDVCTAEPELVALSLMSGKYGSSINQDFDEPQKVIETAIDRDKQNDEAGEYSVVTKEYNVTTIRIDCDHAITLDTTTDITDNNAPNLKLDFSEIETAMVLMQIPDELDKTLQKTEAMIGADYETVSNLDGAVKDKLSVYAMMAEMKGD